MARNLNWYLTDQTISSIDFAKAMKSNWNTGLFNVYNNLFDSGSYYPYGFNAFANAELYNGLKILVYNNTTTEANKGIQQRVPTTSTNKNNNQFKYFVAAVCTLSSNPAWYDSTHKHIRTVNDPLSLYMVECRDSYYYEEEV